MPIKVNWDDPNISTLYSVMKAKGFSHQQMAYVLGTVQHETGNTYKPVREKYNGTPQEYFRNYSGGWQYHGRGYVQLTHDYNYEYAQRILDKNGYGENVMKNPDLLLQDSDRMRRANALITTQGLMDGQYGDPLTRYINDDKTDYYNARASVNRNDRGTYGKVAEYAEKWEEAIRNHEIEQAQREELRRQTGGSFGSKVELTE